MTTISAKTILRSRNTAAPGCVLSTLLLRYPRFIHSEFMTHRAFSRNAASSRAIPFEKQLAAVREDPATPLFWGAEKKGMQGGEELTGAALYQAQSAWDRACRDAIHAANVLHMSLAHKQIVNRVIEPFTHITVLVSATEWGNFLELRDHDAAEPHMRMLAQAIRRELETGPIQDLHPGEWHLPFVETNEFGLDASIRLSVGRCASTSYKTVDGFDMTLERASVLHDQFRDARPQHASPLEHVACADDIYMDRLGEWGWRWSSQHGNFDGFRQYRHII